MSVAPLVPVVAVMPLPEAAEPANAIDGSTAVSATATTVATAQARPIDENTAFRVTITTSSVIAWPDRPWIANHCADVRFPNPNAG